MSPGSKGIASRLERVKEEVANACRLAGRDPASVCLIAVSKGHGEAAILEAYAAGQRDFGESYVQEWLEKRGSLPSDIRWHFIGRLQTNKIKLLNFSGWTLHTLTSAKQLMKLESLGTEIPAMIQVNVDEDPQKSGILTTDLDKLLQDAADCSRVQVLGLMTLGKVVSQEEEARTTFRKLADLAAEYGLADLSMGMSGDFRVAIQEGATHVRVGTAIFGARQ